MSQDHLIADIPVKAIIVRNGKICLVQEGDGRWGLPGGRIDIGESVQEALRREIKEEIGCDIQVGKIVDCDIFTSKSGMHHFIVVFLATMIDEIQNFLVDGAEVVSAEWIDPDGMKNLRILPQYVSILERYLRKEKNV